MSKPNKKIRVRFAPSPTGHFTAGNARTALFNWLYARRYGGDFLLRIEDTDAERSKKEFEEGILEGLKWLGLSWDEKIFRQSERKEGYKKHLKKLLEDGSAYYCFCTKKDLEQEKERQTNLGLAPKYGGKCSQISPDKAKETKKKGVESVIRFRMPDETIRFDDMVRREVEFDGGLIGDFVIAKDEESPLYNFAVVVDDHEMGVTHVIRGEDHISNTPKQIAIQKALGFDEMSFAHLPLIMSPGGGKLSKRELHKSIIDYKNDGYLSEAVFNFLLLIGWHPKEDREVVSREEALKEFSIERVQKSGGVFNEEKLDWYNAYYIRNKPSEELIKDLEPFIPKDWLVDERQNFVCNILEIEKERMKKLTDFTDLASFFFELPEYPAELVLWKDEKEASIDSLEKVYNFIKKLPDNDFNEKNIKDFMEKLSGEKGGRGEVYWPIRAALSGRKESPNAIEIMFVLGKKETLKRIEKARKNLGN